MAMIFYQYLTSDMALIHALIGFPECYRMLGFELVLLIEESSSLSRVF